MWCQTKAAMKLCNCRYCVMQQQQDIRWPEIMFYSRFLYKHQKCIVFLHSRLLLYYKSKSALCIFDLRFSCVWAALFLSVHFIPLFLFTWCTYPLLSECMVQMKANLVMYVTLCWYGGAKTICESTAGDGLVWFFFYRNFKFFLNILKKFQHVRRE